MRVDVLDILAVVFGVWFTVRKLDAQSRQARDFPHVEPGAFAAWQRLEVGVYQLASLGCLLKVLLDVSFTSFGLSRVPPPLGRAVGAAIDVGWLLLLLVTFVRAAGARRRRQDLGVHLGMRPGPGGWDAPEEEEPENDRSRGPSAGPKG
jgi:hypothetical protein